MVHYFILYEGGLRRFRHLNLETKIDVLYGLMHGACAQNVDIVYRALLEVGLCDISTGLQQELPLSCPLLAQTLRYANKLGAFDIVEHDDVGPSVNCLVRFGLGANFDVEEKTEASYLACLLDSSGNRTRGPNVVVLEHDHAREVVPVRVDTSHQHSVFLDQPETRCSLPGASYGALEPVSSRKILDPLGLGSDPTTARQHIQGDALPEQQVPGLTGYSRDVFHGLKGLAFFDEPDDLATQLREDFCEERGASQDGWNFAFAEEIGFPHGFTDYISAIVERGRVLGQPSCHLGFPAGRQQMRV